MGRATPATQMYGGEPGFRSEVETFCALVERGRFAIPELLGSLLRLVELGLGLPELEPGSGLAADDLSGLEADARRVAGNVARSIGLDFYWEILDPRELANPNQTVGSLIDDVVEIYKDLRFGLHLTNTGHHLAATRDWRIRLGARWGAHATSAIRVLFGIVSGTV